MTSTISAEAISPLRRRMIEDMSVRKFGEKTRQDYIRHVEAFAKFLGRSPDTAIGEDLRRYQVLRPRTSTVQEFSVKASSIRLGRSRATSDARGQPPAVGAKAMKR
jgi:hypothetical protein